MFGSFYSFGTLGLFAGEYSSPEGPPITFTPSFVFSDARNSQYVPLIAF